MLDAAHLRPYAELGPHRLKRGILLKDLHALFVAGYVTVTPTLELRVSRRIREEFENGRDSYAPRGRIGPGASAAGSAPVSRILEWHSDTVFGR